MKGAGAPKTKPNAPVASWLPFWARWLVTAVAVFYLFLLGTSTMSEDPASAMPQTVRYFTQVAKLFPDAATHSIDYRLEGYDCAARKWTELDYRKYFPLRPDDKENRYQRLAFFYGFRPNRKVLEALAAFMITRHNSGAYAPDGIDGKIGGIQVLSLLIPVPPVGRDIERWSHKPLNEFPDGYRKVYYHTRQSVLTANCGGVAPTSQPATDDIP